MYIGLFIEGFFRFHNPQKPQHVSIYLYYGVLFLPTIFTINVVAALIDMVVPLMGRIGASAPTDIIIGGLTGSLVFWMAYLVIPAFQRISTYSMWRVIRVVAMVSLVLPLIFQLLIPAYDVTHPKRMWYVV